MQDQDSALLHAFVLDGRGGARSITRHELDNLQLSEQDSLWLHWDRGHPHTHNWLRAESGLNEFACNLLLEENTRPRLLALPEQQLLLFLRGLNLNPGAEPEDMVSVRIFADAQRAISLRLRPLMATEALIEDLLAGRGGGGTVCGGGWCWTDGRAPAARWGVRLSIKSRRTPRPRIGRPPMHSPGRPPCRMA